MKYHVILSGATTPVIINAIAASINDGCLVLVDQNNAVVYAVGKGGWTFVASESALVTTPTAILPA
jgi:hypothetical protein